MPSPSSGGDYQETRNDDLEEMVSRVMYTSGGDDAELRDK